MIKIVSFDCFQEFPINPKALSLGELYGEFDLNTNEWTDGVLSSVMRQTCAGKIQMLIYYMARLEKGREVEKEGKRQRSKEIERLQ